MTFAKKSDVKVGDFLLSDGGFTCVPEGVALLVEADDRGFLYIKCSHGKHYLDGQLDFKDAETYVGLTKLNPGDENYPV